MSQPRRNLSRIYILRKSVVVLAVSSLIVLAMGLFSVGSWTYAGFAAAFLGAAYLLNAWVKYMRARGRRVLPGRRQARSLTLRSRRAPYFHRNEKTDRPGIRSIGYHYEDSLEDEHEDEQKDSLEDEHEDEQKDSLEDEHEDEQDDGRLPEPLRLKADSTAYAICGALLLIASLFIN